MSSSRRKTLCNNTSSAAKRRKTVLMHTKNTPLLNVEEDASASDDTSDDEIEFQDKETFHDANEVDVTQEEEEEDEVYTDAEMAQKYRELFQQACRQLNEYEDRIETLEAQLEAKARANCGQKKDAENVNLINTANTMPASNVDIAGAKTVQQRPTPRVAPPTQMTSMMMEIQNMKKRLRHRETPKSNKKKAHTPACAPGSAAASLLSSLAFRRSCIAVDSPTNDSPGAEKGAFGTPMKNQKQLFDGC